MLEPPPVVREQRYKAVQPVIRDGHSVVEVTCRWEVSEQTVPASI
jgi:hypothetical protein